MSTENAKKNVLPPAKTVSRGNPSPAFGKPEKVDEAGLEAQAETVRGKGRAKTRRVDVTKAESSVKMSEILSAFLQIPSAQREKVSHVLDNTVWLTANHLDQMRDHLEESESDYVISMKPNSAFEKIRKEGVSWLIKINISLDELRAAFPAAERASRGSAIEDWYTSRTRKVTQDFNGAIEIAKERGYLNCVSAYRIETEDTHAENDNGKTTRRTRNRDFVYVINGKEITGKVTTIGEAGVDSKSDSEREYYQVTFRYGEETRTLGSQGIANLANSLMRLQDFTIEPV